MSLAHLLFSFPSHISDLISKKEQSSLQQSTATQHNECSYRKDSPVHKLVSAREHRLSSPVRTYHVCDPSGQIKPLTLVQTTNSKNIPRTQIVVVSSSTFSRHIVTIISNRVRQNKNFYSKTRLPNANNMGYSTSAKYLMATVSRGSYGAAVRNSAKRARNALPASNPFSTFDADVEAEENMAFFEELPMHGMNRHLIGFFKTKVQRACGNLRLRWYLRLVSACHGVDTTAAYAQALTGWWPKEDSQFRLPNLWLDGECYYIVNKRLTRMGMGASKEPTLLCVV